MEPSRDEPRVTQRVQPPREPAHPSDRPAGCSIFVVGYLVAVALLVVLGGIAYIWKLV